MLDRDPLYKPALEYHELPTPGKVSIASAIARASMGSGVATLPIADFDAYEQQPRNP